MTSGAPAASSLARISTMTKAARLSAPALATAVALAPAVASAHTGIGQTAGFLHGFWHPIGGIDHVLAMVAVGLFAAQLGGRALWAVPATFVAVMAAGGALGMAGVGLPAVEVGIALSVLVLGLVVLAGAGRLGWLWPWSACSPCSMATPNAGRCVRPYLR